MKNLFHRRFINIESPSIDRKQKSIIITVISNHKKLEVQSC